MVRAWIVNAIEMGVKAGQYQPYDTWDPAIYDSMAAFLDDNPSGTFEEYRVSEVGSRVLGE